MKQVPTFILLLTCIASATLGQSWQSLGEGVHGPVYAIVLGEDGVYVGGLFGGAGGEEDADYLARWDGEAWHAVAPGLRGPVHAIAFHDDDLYVGGAFPDIEGVPNSKYLARWDGQAWHAVGTGVNHYVKAIAVQGDSIFIGGAFTNAGDLPDGDYIATWTGGTWHPLSGGLTSMNPGIGAGVNAIAVQHDNVYIGGNFSQAGDVADTWNIARWDGEAWHALGTGFWGDMGVLAIASNGNDLYVGGDGGVWDTTGCGILRWDGQQWYPLGTGVSDCLYAEGPYSIAAYGTSTYTGGLFKNAGNKPMTACLAMWDGSQWNALGSPGLETDPFNPDYILAMATDGQNLFVGGVFDDIGGVAGTRNIAVWGDLAAATEDEEALDLSEKISVFPNPATDHIQIQATDEQISLYEYRLLDSHGRVILHDRFPHTTVNIRHLPGGVYTLLVASSHVSAVYRVIKP